MSKQIYTQVTAKIVEQLEKGTAPWVRPWSQSAGGKSRWNPHNVVSNRDYHGINAVLLTMIGQQYPTGAWATYKQIKEAGGQVRKGEKGTQIVWFGKIEIEDKKSPDKVKLIPLLRFFTVFNHAQADWEQGKDPLAKGATNEDDTSGDDIPSAQATIDATGAKIKHGGDRAFYAPGPDFITLPPKKAFKGGVEHYYATAFHELTHWTAHPDRLKRNLSGRFGDKDYAFEELVAELGSAFLCASHSIDGELRHAEYLGHWIKGLKEDDQAIFKAAALAQKAADFVLGASEHQQEQEAA